MMTSTLLALALTLSAPKIDVSVRDLNDGDTLSRERSIRVTVQSTHPIRSVEFYVGDDLRDSDSSTPYEFKIDPLNESEGNITLVFAAYDTEGGSQKKTLKLKVDTGASKGAAKLIEESNEALAARKFDYAVFLARVALKSAPKDNGARLALARAFLGKGIYDKAQQFAEDAIAADANNTDARELLAGINLRRAFDTFSRGSGDRTATVKTIGEALKTAATIRRENTERRLDAFGSPTAENAIQWADLALRAGRFNAASTALDREFAKAPNNSAIGNRMAYAYLRQNRIEDAAFILSRMEREKAIDAYGSALAAVVADMKGDTAKADQYIADGQGNDPDELGVRAAQAFLAIRRGRTNALTSIVTSLSRNESPRAEVNYYLAVLQYRLNNFVESDRAFEAAIAADPAFVDMYVERGNQALGLLASGRITDANQRGYQVQVAQAYFDAALASKPDSPLALTGLALLAAANGKRDEAASLAQAATAAGPDYAAGHFVATYIFTGIDQDLMARASNIRKSATGPLNDSQKEEVAVLEDRAKKLKDASEAARKKAIALDNRNLGGRPIPTLSEAFEYFYRDGRLPLLTLPR
jgi:thioredoxin-like negative regulator of GroEL